MENHHAHGKTHYVYGQFQWQPVGMGPEGILQLQGNTSTSDLGYQVMSGVAKWQSPLAFWGPEATMGIRFTLFTSAYIMSTNINRGGEEPVVTE